MSVSGLGGKLLGLFGFGSWDGAQFLSTGRGGYHGQPDGRVSASQMNLSVNDAGDNYLINDTLADVLLINDV